MPAILLPLSVFLSNSLSFSQFCYFAFPLFSFLVLARVMLYFWCYGDVIVVMCCDTMTIVVTMHDGVSLYTVCRDWYFTISPFNHFCLGMGVLPDHPLVCQLPNHHHLPVLAMPYPITRQRILFYLLFHRGISIQIRVGILSHYLSLPLMACT